MWVSSVYHPQRNKINPVKCLFLFGKISHLSNLCGVGACTCVRVRVRVRVRVFARFLPSFFKAVKNRASTAALV